MAYEEFPEITCSYSCEAAMHVRDRLKTIEFDAGIGHPAADQYGTLRQMALEANSSNCDPDNCILGGLEGVLARLEEVRRDDPVPEKTRDSVVVIHKRAPSFWDESAFGD